MELSFEVISAIHDLPERKARVLLKHLREGIPLNRRLKKLLEMAERDAESSELANWREENDGWGIE